MPRPTPFRSEVVDAGTAGRPVTHGPFGFAFSRMGEGTSLTSPLRAPRLITSTPLPRPSDGRRGPHRRLFYRGAFEVTSVTISGCGGCVDRAQHGEAACSKFVMRRRAQMWQVPSAVRETASPNGPCVIRRPAIDAISTSSRKESPVSRRIGPEGSRLQFPARPMVPATSAPSYAASAALFPKTHWQIRPQPPRPSAYNCAVAFCREETHA